MIFFRVTQNINIKTTDGTLVNYFKLKVPSGLTIVLVVLPSPDGPKIAMIFAIICLFLKFVKIKRVIY